MKPPGTKSWLRSHVAASLFAIAALCVGLMAQQSAGVPSGGRKKVAPRPSPLGSQDTIRPAGFSTEKLVGDLRLDTHGKTLSIRWTYVDPMGASHKYTEGFDLSFWPTAAARVNDTRLTRGSHFVIAGKRPSNGHTVIERWELTLSGIPSAESATAVQKTTLYDASVTGKRVVQRMGAVNGISDAVFVHFDDSGDLYSMSTDSGAMALALTPEQAPELTFDSYSWWTGGKTTDGAYVYVYQCDFTVHADGSLVLYDLDGDGSIDQWTSVGRHEMELLEQVDWLEVY